MGKKRPPRPHGRQKFAVRIGTFFERSHIPLHKWLLATHPTTSEQKQCSFTSRGSGVILTGLNGDPAHGSRGNVSADSLRGFPDAASDDKRRSRWPATLQRADAQSQPSGALFFGRSYC